MSYEAERHPTTDLFLIHTGVTTTESAMLNSLQSALQHNKTYQAGSDSRLRDAFRAKWAELICDEARSYRQPVSDRRHCETIGRISNALQAQFGRLLCDGRLRYGTSQKALNLYLKFQWRRGQITTPPHCPVDRIVLGEGQIDGVWTKCDSESQYMEWIDTLRSKAKPLCLADWEHEIWLRRVAK